MAKHDKSERLRVLETDRGKEDEESIFVFRFPATVEIEIEADELRQAQKLFEKLRANQPGCFYADGKSPGVVGIYAFPQWWLQKPEVYKR